MKEYEGVAQKITRTLFLAQSVVSAALITTTTINAIVGAELSGITAWAGFPATVFLIAAALGAYIWGLIMERLGRRVGLVIGLVIGAIGGLTAAFAIWRGSFPIFLVGMGMFGLAQSAMLLGRFAAAEVNPAANRGQAIATVVLGGTVGAIVGPLLVGPTGNWATRVGFDELTGPYVASLVLFIVAASIVFFLLRPDPSKVAKAIALEDQAINGKTGSQRPMAEILRQPGVLVAILGMVLGQAVMVMVMVITSLHMKALGYPLSAISIVISAHTIGMFAFSIFSGRLADRIGREPVIMLGSVTLILAGVGAGLSNDILPIAIALFLLGLGWNLCYVGGSTLLTDQLSLAEQPRMQGMNDLFVGFASALGSLGSGFVFVAVGFQVMGLIGAGLAVIPFTAALWWMRNPVRLSTTSPAHSS